MRFMVWMLAITVGISSIAPGAFASKTATDALSPWKLENFSYAYWLNGWRKNADDTSPDILCFETGHYGMTLDVADFSKTRFGRFNDNVGYTEALASGAWRELTARELAQLLSSP